MRSRPHVYLVAAILFSGLIVGVQAQQTTGPSTMERPMRYEAKDFSHLVGMEGLSEALIRNHLQLYQGYVTNTNRFIDELSKMTPDKADPKYAELKRRFGFEFDGMRLHEFYFGNLGGGGGDLPDNTPLYRRLAQDFGGYDQWKKDFLATGGMRGVGWAALYEDPFSGRLFNWWVELHHDNHPAGCNLIMIMDVWEHAFMLDYGLDRAAYIDAFFRNLDWEVVAGRYDAAQRGR